MHPVSVREEVRRLAALGVNDCEIGRRLGIARTTVRDIARPRYRPRTEREPCARCWRPTKPVRFTDEGYAYVLGLYLGDGCISAGARTYSFRLSLDAKYPGIIAEAKAALEAGLPGHPVSLHFAGPEGTAAVLCLYSTHLPCLFPQHGAGKKHTREIRLEPWQRAIVERAPWSLIRGLIQSDGCRFVNRTGRYAYPSYEFTQTSDDIRRIFTEACDLVGIAYRVNGLRVRIYRRASVALMEEHVGPKR